MPQSEIFRAPTQTERLIFARLLETEFPGRDQLREQLADAIVRPLDEHGCLEIKSDSATLADVKERVPVEAEEDDTDGVSVYYLLHVVDGRAVELEIYKADGTPIQHFPEPEELRITIR